MSDFLTAALSYQKRGLSVIPIQPRDKKPLVPWEPSQSRPATEDEIKAWWAKSHDANVGIVTGAVSGLVVIDLDTPEAKEKLKELVPGFDFNMVPRSRTGNGWQFFFQHPGVPVANRAGVLPGLDVRADGGYVVAPPSIHPNGKQYKWEVPINGELPKLPVELFKLITSQGNGAIREAAPPIEGSIPEGQRNASLTSLAGSMRQRGMSEASILAALQEENKIRCNPPLPDSEVETIAKSVSRYSAADSREHLTPKSSCSNELGVTCSRDEDEGTPLDCAPVLFPDAAWSGLFGHWRDVVAPCTEAPLEFLWSSFLVNVGLILGRNVWIESPQPLYPNFYVLLLGQTGDARKSTALWLARQLLKRLDEDVEIITGIVSTEGLFERLAKHEYTRALGYVDEFRSLLSVGRRQGTRDLLPKLNSLIYCPDHETIDRRKDPTTVIRPQIREVTFKDFGAVAKKRGHTVESLADRFRGKIENPSEFFERVLSSRYKGEDRSSVVITYRSVLEFYNEELHYFQDSNQKHRQCACGCGQPVFDRKKWASAACKKRIQRNGERRAA